MLDETNTEISTTRLRKLCQNNELFASGVLRELCETEFCLFSPSKANKFSQMGFIFPHNTSEAFLDCILDCVELLGNKPAKLKKFVSEDGENNDNKYTLLIKDIDLIRKIASVDRDNPWNTAGNLFVDLNKNKLENKDISIICSRFYGRNIMNSIDKLTFLLL